MNPKKSLLYETFESLHRVHLQHRHGRDAAVLVRDHFIETGRSLYAPKAYLHVLRIEDADGNPVT